MDKDTARYIIQYFPGSMNEIETRALKNLLIAPKIAYSSDLSLEKAYEKQYLMHRDVAVQQLVIIGLENFELRTAERILKETPDKVFLNNCSKCGRLARSPYARQCRYCKHNWHHIVTAQFQLQKVFQVTNRNFFLSGNIISGEIDFNNFIDLTIIGLNKKPAIKAMEYIRSSSGILIGLGTDELSDEDEEYLKDKRSFPSNLQILTVNY